MSTFYAPDPTAVNVGDVLTFTGSEQFAAMGDVGRISTVDVRDTRWHLTGLGGQRVRVERLESPIPPPEPIGCDCGCECCS